MGWGSAPRKRSSAILIDEHVIETGMVLLTGEEFVEAGEGVVVCGLVGRLARDGRGGVGVGGRHGRETGGVACGVAGAAGEGYGYIYGGGQREGTRPTICELIRSRGDAAVDGAPKREGRTPVWK